MITIVYKIDEEKWQLIGCEGTYKTSTWQCDNCDEKRRLTCRELLNGHPDLMGRPVA